MERLLTAALAFTASLYLAAQSPYVPPDYFNEPYKAAIGFWENKGQVITTSGTPASDVQFYSEGCVPRAYLRKGSKVSFVMAEVDTNMATVDTLYRLDMQPFGPRARRVDPISMVVKDWFQNFYLPHCGPTGVTHVLGYSRVVYEGIFPKIDMHFYSGSQGQKMAFVLKPGCDPSELKLAFSGQDSLKVDPMGMLKIYYKGKYVVLPWAQAYQVGTAGNIIPISWVPSFDVANGLVSFTYSSYNALLPLVFQVGIPFMNGPPHTSGVCYSTFFGGGSSDQITANTIDANGNHYVTGFTYSTFTSFPGNAGANLFTGSPSIYACRINDQDHIAWKDFVGGSGGMQFPWGIAVRSGAHPKLYLGGQTACADFYHQDADSGNDYYDPSGSGNSGFIVRLDPDEGLLEHSTYFGNENVYINDVTIDPSGRLIVVGETGGNLPVHQVPLPPGAEQWGLGGLEDGFIAMFNLNDQLLWSTPFGGHSSDNASTVRASGSKIVVAGTAGPGSFPQALNGGGDWNQNTTAGTGDVMLLEFNQNGDEQWGTLFGGSGFDHLGKHGLDIDPITGDIYVVGYTFSTDLPLFHPTDWYDPTPPSSAYNGFIAEFTNARNRRWVTYASSSSSGMLNAVRLGQDREIFIGGVAGANFPCHAMNGLYSTNAPYGISDGVIMRFDQAHNYLWGTYFGGDGSGATADEIRSIALKEGERLYLSGYTTSSYDQTHFFPLTDEDIAGSWFEDYNQLPADGFIAAFCIGSEVGVVAINSTDDNRLLAWHEASGEWSVSGASPGMQTLLVCDAVGRVVLRFVVRVPVGAPLRIELGSLSPAAYVLRIGERSTKILTF